MKSFWLLKRRYAGPGEVESVVILADSESKARFLAASNRGFEAEEVWLSPKSSSCTLLSLDGEDRVVLSCGIFN